MYIMAIGSERASTRWIGNSSLTDQDSLACPWLLAKRLRGRDSCFLKAHRAGLGHPSNLRPFKEEKEATSGRGAGLAEVNWTIRVINSSATKSRAAGVSFAV